MLVFICYSKTIQGTFLNYPIILSEILCWLFLIWSFYIDFKDLGFGYIFKKELNLLDLPIKSYKTISKLDRNNNNKNTINYFLI